MNPQDTSRSCHSGEAGFLSAGDQRAYENTRALASHGRLVDRVTGDRKIPHSENAQWKKLSTNGLTHCGIADDGSLWAWGAPPLGDGTITGSEQPRLISSDKWIDVSVGRVDKTRGAQVLQSTTVYSSPVAYQWPVVSFENSDNPDCRATYVLAIRESDGSLWGWGSNVGGVLGNGKAAPGLLEIRPRVYLSGSVSSVTPLPASPVEIFFNSIDPYGNLTVKSDDPEGDSLVTRRAVIKPRIRTEFVTPGGDLFVNNYGEYRSTPTIETYIVDESGNEITASDETQHASFDAAIMYSVVGVTVVSQSAPTRGPVVVSFSGRRLPDSSHASAECTVDAAGYVTSISVLDGGLYEEPPKAAVNASGAEVQVSVVLAAKVRGVRAKTRGVYYDRFDRIRVRAKAPPADVISEAVIVLPLDAPFLSVSYESFEVLDGGDGYTVIDGLEGTGPGMSSHRLTARTPPTSNVIAPQGFQVGLCSLAPSPTRGLSLTPTTTASALTTATRIITSSRYGLYSLPYATTSQTILVGSYFSSSPPPAVTARVIWIGSDRTPVPCTTAWSLFYGNIYRLRVVVPSIYDPVRDSTPVIEVNVPTMVVDDQDDGNVTGGIEKEIGTFGGAMRYWSPGAVYTGAGEVERTFAGGDVWRPADSSGIPRTFKKYWEYVPNSVAGGGGRWYPVAQQKSLLRVVTTTPAHTRLVGFDLHPSGIGNRLEYFPQRGFEVQPLSIAWAGGETGTRRVSMSATHSATERDTVSITVSIDEQGAGYETEPLPVITNLVLSLSPSDNARQYTSVCAMTLANRSAAVSGGRVYEWGEQSLTGLYRPSLRPYSLSIKAPDYPTHISLVSPSVWINAWLSGVSKPIVPVCAMFGGSPAYAIRMPKDEFPEEVMLSRSVEFYGPSGVNSQSGGGIGLDRSPTGLEVIFPPTGGGWITAPPSTDEYSCKVIKPAEPVKAISRRQSRPPPDINSLNLFRETNDLIVVDANDDTWILREDPVRDAGNVYPRDGAVNLSDHTAQLRSTRIGPPVLTKVSESLPSVKASFAVAPEFVITGGDGKTYQQFEFWDRTQSVSLKTSSLPPAYLFWGYDPIESWDESDHYVVLEPSSESYPFISLDSKSAVTLKRTGGEYARVTVGAQKLDGAWDITYSTADKTQSLTSGIVSASGTVHLQPSTLTYTQLPKYEASVSAEWDNNTLSVSLCNGKIENVYSSSIDMIISSRPVNSSSFDFYWTQLPSFELSVNGVAIPLSLVTYRLDRFVGDAVKIHKPTVSLKAHPEVADFAIMPDGTAQFITDGFFGMHRQAASASGVTSLSASGFISCDGGVQYCGANSYSTYRVLTIEGNAYLSNIDIDVTDGGEDYTEVPLVTPSFVPNGIAHVEATIDGKVESIGLEKKGSGFKTPPTVVFSGGEGSGAEAEAKIEGPLGEIAVANAGSGYDVPPEVRLVGRGIAAMATARVSGGAVQAIDISYGGLYQVLPTVQFVSSKRVVSISVTDGGDGYSSAPSVVVCGRGSGAAGFAVISAELSDVIIESGGGGYDASLPPSVEVVSVDGFGSGAEVSLVVDPETGIVSSATINSPGSGYRLPPQLIVSGGGGCRLVAKISGFVESVVVTAGGHGYKTPPVVLFQGGGGSGATATASTQDIGSGATASATLNGYVYGVVVTNKGSGYQHSPDVFLVGGGNATAAAAYSALQAGDISRKAYNDTPSVAVAQARIEGRMSNLTVVSGGSTYSSLFNGGSLKRETDYRRSHATGIDPVFFSFGPRFQSTAVPGDSFFWNDTRDDQARMLHPSWLMVRELNAGLLLATDKYPDGSVYATGGTESVQDVFFQRPLIVPCNGHLFYVSGIEGSRTVSAAVRSPYTFSLSRASANYGIDVLTASAMNVFRCEDLTGKTLTRAVIDGYNAGLSGYYGQGVRLSSGMILNHVRFSAPPVFVLSDPAGTGASVQCSLDESGKIVSLDVAAQGASYTEKCVVAMSSCNVKKAACECECVVSASGSISHIVVTSPGNGFISPVAVIHGGGGSGANCRAVTVLSDSPSGIAAVTVIDGGSGYSQQSPPSVYIYDAIDVDAKIAEEFSAAARDFPLRSSPKTLLESGAQPFGPTFSYGKTCGWFTGATIRHCDPERIDLAATDASSRAFFNSFDVQHDGFDGLLSHDTPDSFYARYGYGFHGGNNSGVYDETEVPKRPRFHLFKRFNKITSVRHVSPPYYRIPSSTSGILPATAAPYTSMPALSFQGATSSRPPSVSVSEAKFDSGVSDVGLGTFLIKRKS
jgi:hypothetical protein